jgi:tRNA threonylcarbamoyladenosine biosynthesis protein TsaE
MHTKKEGSRIVKLADLPIVAQQILDDASKVAVIGLQGTLGAGKTTLAIEILKYFGIKGETQSPTYTYMQMYQLADEKSIYHFDVYRLPDKQAFLFAGFDEFLYQPNSLAIIEWPEIIISLLDHDVCLIQIEYIDDVTRKISWTVQ